LEVLKSVAGQIGGRTLCALGDFAISPVLSTMRHFFDEYEAKVSGKKVEKETAVPVSQ
jgi:NADH-quinone oxidoreductase subunit F